MKWGGQESHLWEDDIRAQEWMGRENAVKIVSKELAKTISKREYKTVEHHWTVYTTNSSKTLNDKKI